ncbi:hypothetical protein D3C75_980910 [compost metagenome]
MHGKIVQVIGFHTWENRWHKAPDGFAINDGIADLAGLLRNQTAPDRIAFRPEILPFIIKTLRLTIEHDPQRNTVDAGANPAVIQRGASINSHAVRLGRVTNHIGPRLHHKLEQHPLIKTGTTDQKVICRPFTCVILPPGLTQPLTVGFKPTRG